MIDILFQKVDRTILRAGTTLKRPAFAVRERRRKWRWLEIGLALKRSPSTKCKRAKQNQNSIRCFVRMRLKVVKD